MIEILSRCDSRAAGIALRHRTNYRCSLFPQVSILSILVWASHFVCDRAVSDMDYLPKLTCVAVD